MKTNLCRQLDDFLSGSLDDAQRDEFAAHLEFCDDCRREVELDSRLDRLLMTAVDRETVPAGLASRVVGSIRRAQRRRHAVTVLSAAAVACFAAGWLIFDFGTHGDPEPSGNRRQVADRASLQTPAARQASGNRSADAKVSSVAGTRADARAAGSSNSRPFVQVDLPDDTIGVPVETQNPNVTIIMLYPTVSRALGSGSSNQE